MKEESVILIAEDDDRHFSLIKRNLRLAGIHNQIVRFVDGQEALDYLLTEGEEAKQRENGACVLLLGISMPKLDGVKVLDKIKQDPTAGKIPVIILSSRDDPKTVEHCHTLGCSVYVVKPGDDETFAETMQKVGLFLANVELPQVSAIE
ncbi:MAG: response regulator [Planctomycetota bacterium]|jgi:CheY-like chemotaxis protein